MTWLTETTWTSNRTKNWTKSRDYMLGSFFSTVLKAITDPKDDKALGIKTDPAYYDKAKWKTRNTAESSFRDGRS